MNRAALTGRDRQAVFGAGGALLFMLLSGLLVARFSPGRATAAA